MTGVAASSVSLKTVTFRYEKIRSVAAGVVETAASTFLLLIAVKYYHAGAISKSLLAVSWSTGLLATPLVVGVVRRSRVAASRGAAWLAIIAATCLLAPSIIPSLTLFVGASLVGFTCMGATVPLLTQVYQDNYPVAERGDLFSRTVVFRIVAAALFSWLAGRLLNADIGRSQAVLGCFSAALFVSAHCLWRIPSQPLKHDEGAHPLHALRAVKHDLTFRWTLVSWMLMGFSNLLMLPLRVEYLANPRYGVALSAAQVALFTGVLPNVTRLLMSRVWGVLFDRMNFFLLRILLNIGFMTAILTFFGSGTGLSLAAGALIFGVAMGGGDIAWSLWVTKLAPPDRVAEYMAVHTFFTGIRGIAAPFLAFQLIQVVSVGWMAVGCGVLIVAASLLLVPEVTSVRRLRAAEPLVPRGEQ